MLFTNARPFRYGRGLITCQGRGCSIIGYVILPNHLHALIHLPVGIKNLNTIISNGKRFIAYEIFKRLEEQKAEPLL